jgi:hypothetical protein
MVLFGGWVGLGNGWMGGMGRMGGWVDGEMGGFKEWVDGWAKSWLHEYKRYVQ